MESLMGGEEDLSSFVLSTHVAHKWRHFVLATVHLRFADAAEQQEILPVKENNCGKFETRVVKRRASIFGSVMGVYRAEIQEGEISVHHCLGDQVADIAQELRVRKAHSSHRPNNRSDLYYDEMAGKESEPRKLPLPPLVSQTIMIVGPSTLFCLPSCQVTIQTVMLSDNPPR
jgi:hypothetical protein